jgi:hypothetical protein
MKKSSEGIIYFMICASVIIIISLACNFPTISGNDLNLDSRDEDGGVSGTYQSPESSGDQKVDFSVTNDGFATFQVEGASESETLTIDLSDEQSANMEWKGVSLDGLGALTGEEQAALEDLMHSDLSHGLGMIPLDISCQGDENIDAKQVAALLVPLQMRFKYLVSDRAAEANNLIASSQCDYGGSRESQVENASLIMLSPSAPVPVVFGYFPFDEEGAVEPPKSSVIGWEVACVAASPLVSADGLVSLNFLGSQSETIFGNRINEEGPCNALCRGACGADCEPNNCAQSEEIRCEKDEAGNNTGMEFKYQIYDCGLHQGCIDHDNCYDQCNAEYGCDTWSAAVCRHAWTIDTVLMISQPNWWCDQKAIAEYGPIYPPLWMEGYGPQPMRETFEYLDEDYGKQKNLDRCPLDESDSPITDDEETTIPVGTYIGTTDYDKVWELFYTAGGSASKNEVVITVAEDGTVSGSLSLIFTSGTFTHEDNGCTEIWNLNITGSFIGQLTGMHGTIDSEEYHTCSTTGTCSTEGSCGEEPLIRQIDIQVSGDQMTGITLPHPEDPDGFFTWSFHASKP